jgi:SIR2-like domain
MSQISTESPMIDPLISLAFSVHSLKGAYALLLGSGVSRSSGIPTGWEIVLDLICKVAALNGENCEPDPEVWYTGKYGQEPRYSELLEQLAASPAERNRLLRSYFEPTAKERKEGKKRPMQAHEAIAELVDGGYIRVIVTTNFDRLVENALEARGIIASVISTPDAVEGTLPLVHNRCTVIKVHGDYLDTRMKNAPAELEEYDPRIDQLLDRVFDDYGLVVCGWSADWDTALRRALQRCKNHRFSTYWCIRGEPGALARDIIAERRAQLVPIRDADSFFEELAKKVFALQEPTTSRPLTAKVEIAALEEATTPRPVSAKAAIASLKEYLSEDKYRIELHDLVMQETERLYAVQAGSEFAADEKSAAQTELQSHFQHRVQLLEANTEVLQALFATGCFWGQSQHQALWTRSIERIANPQGSRSGFVIWINLRRYPALLLLYAGGIASIAAGNYGMLVALLVGAKVREDGKAKPLVLGVNTWAVMERGAGQMLPDMDRHFVPVSDHLYARLRDPLRSQIPSDDEYQACFDRFEYLLGLAYADLESDTEIRGVGPIGCFGWRYQRHFADEPAGLMEWVSEEARQAGESWAPLRAGMFRGSLERFWEVKTAFDRFVRDQVARWW